MRFVRHLVDLPFEQLSSGSVVTIGAFDGLHLGHRQLLRRVTDEAKRNQLPSVVMSFEPTPKEFFAAKSPPARLMRFREKFEALAALGIDIFYCPRFDTAMRNIAADTFIRRILIQGLNTRRIVVGDDFHFARKREGSHEHLQRCSAALNLVVEKQPSVMVADVRASSTVIREALHAGDLQRASDLLGRPYRMSGKIIRGRRVGRSLGFATANVDLRRRQSAVTGIFAVRVSGLPEGALNGVASVGTRPTFDLKKPLLEVYLFDFDRDIYGEYIHVDFIARLRDEEKFESVENLVAQMHVDTENARAALAADAVSRNPD